MMKGWWAENQMAAVIIYDIVYDSKTINLLIVETIFSYFLKSLKSLQNSRVTDFFYLLYLLECKMTLIRDDLQNKTCLSWYHICIQILDDASEIKCLLRQNFSNCIHIIHKACQIL
jgi:hypothetical protein